MYYEERLINGVAYFRHTPNGKWIEKVIDKGVHAGSMTMPVKNCLIADVGDSREVCGTCGGADFAHYGFCPKCDTDAYSY